MHSLISYGCWDEQFIKIFQNCDYYSNDQNEWYRNCPPREFVYCYNLLLNYFAKIGVRIYMNVGKKYLFFSKFKEKFFYDRFLEHTRYLFSSIISNVRKAYIKTAYIKANSRLRFDMLYCFKLFLYSVFEKKMQMRTFLILLDCELKKDYPGVELDFYLSRRSRYVHMGSNIPLNRLDNFQSIINKIQ